MTEQHSEEMGFHVHADGTVHSHAHTHQNTKAVKNRLARIIGHLHAVERMVDDGRDCAEVLIQLAAIRSGRRKLFTRMCSCCTYSASASSMLNTTWFLLRMLSACGDRM